MEMCHALPDFAPFVGTHRDERNNPIAQIGRPVENLKWLKRLAGGRPLPCIDPASLCTGNRHANAINSAIIVICRKAPSWRHVFTL